MLKLSSDIIIKFEVELLFFALLGDLVLWVVKSKIVSIINYVLPLA